MAKNRKNMRRGNSEKVFTRGAQRIHPKNDLRGFVMRGGIRL